MRTKLHATSQRLMPPTRRSLTTDLGLLAARLCFGGLMLVHGWGKLSDFSGGMEKWAAKGVNPIGVGPTLSYTLIVWAEFFCSLLIISGLFTRFAAFNLAFAMCVAAFIQHHGDTLGAGEKALLFLSGYLALLLTGPGRFAADHWLFGRGEQAGPGGGS